MNRTVHRRSGATDTLAFRSMEAEFIVVEGPLLGTRYPLGADDLRIGRAASADVRLTGHQAAWEHCVVRRRDGRYQIVDQRSGTGTYVNGMRTTEHWLEPGDQVSIGETVLVYREDAPAAPCDSQNHTLLRACCAPVSVSRPGRGAESQASRDPGRASSSG